MSSRPWISELGMLTRRQVLRCGALNGAGLLLAGRLLGSDLTRKPTSAEAAPPAPADEAKIAQLRADLEEQESAKRYHEYVKTLVALADEVPDTAEKVELYMKAADLYVNKFVNQAEAVRTYEHILEVDPENRDAIDYLRQMYETDPDQVFNVLAKFGLGEVSAGGTLIAGTERFTLISDSDQGAFMDDLVQMSQYHIIFVPCASTKYWVGAPFVPDARAQNIRDYVEAGGKWYATDHSNEYIEVPFPQYQEFHNPGMPDIQPAYDVTGTVQDPDLLAWLEALPPALKDIGGGNPNLFSLPSVELRLNYSGIDAVYDVIVQDDEGNDVNVGPYTYVSGPCTSCSDQFTFRPMAFAGGFGCGRMMYSTFENSSVAHQGLNPQELVLLYMILEIGVCHDKPPPPIPPVG